MAVTMREKTAPARTVEEVAQPKRLDRKLKVELDTTTHSMPSMNTPPLLLNPETLMMPPRMVEALYVPSVMAPNSSMAVAMIMAPVMVSALLLTDVAKDCKRELEQ